MFSSIGHPGPFGLPPILLATTLLFLLIAFPSAGVVGQEGNSDGKCDGKPKPRHKLFEEEITSCKTAPNVKTENAFNYVCLPFGESGYEDGGDRMFCGCVTKGGEKSKPDTFHYPVVNVDGCLNAFYRIAMMPMCGNEWFDQMKLCALTQFFDDKADFEAVKNDANKKTLLLIDGCAMCSNEAKITKIQVVHTEEAAGGLFSKCNEEERTDVSIDLNIDVPPGGLSANTSSFTVPVVLYHRVCGQIFSDAAVSDKFVGIKLKITHTCGSGGDIIVDLPEVDRTAAPFSDYFVGELRGLQVDLNGGQHKQYRDASTTNDDMPKYTENLAPFVIQNANVKCWFEDSCILEPPK